MTTGGEQSWQVSLSIEGDRSASLRHLTVGHYSFIGSRRSGESKTRFDRRYWRSGAGWPVGVDGISRESQLAAFWLEPRQSLDFVQWPSPAKSWVVLVMTSLYWRYRLKHLVHFSSPLAVHACMIVGQVGASRMLFISLVTSDWLELIFWVETKGQKNRHQVWLGQFKTFICHGKCWRAQVFCYVDDYVKKQAGWPV